MTKNFEDYDVYINTSITDQIILRDDNGIDYLPRIGGYWAFISDITLVPKSLNPCDKEKWQSLGVGSGILQITAESKAFPLQEISADKLIDYTKRLASEIKINFNKFKILGEVPNRLLV